MEVVRISDLLRLLYSINEPGLVSWASPRDYHIDYWIIIADEVDVVLRRRLLA